MPNLSIKDVPEAWAEALRQRAARNHRSLQGELMALVEGAVRATDAAPGNSDRQALQKGKVVGYDRRGQPIVQRGWKPVEDVLATIRAQYPNPSTDVPTSMEILRAEREARDHQLSRPA
jgi:plasmid stability protein